MTNPILAPELLELIDSGDFVTLREVVEAVHPAETADFVAALNDADIWRFLAAVSQQQAAEVFSHFELDRQVELACGANRRAMARMLEELPHDDRADLVQRLDPQVAEQILPLVAKAEREDIRKLVGYAEGTAGALMSSDYATLRPDMSVAQALEQVRLQAPNKETIYYIYVVDQDHGLIGLVSLKDLILARPTQQISDIMHEDVISADVSDDQEPVAHKIEKYDLLAIPVINGDSKLVGIITHDDVMDVIRQEQQEDVEKLMAIRGRHQAGEYLRTPAWTHFRNRVTWVVILAVLGLVSGLIVQSFEGLLLQFAILAAFMPMLADTGGNTGSQSATLVVRALAMEEVRPKDMLRVILKELKVSVLLACVLATVAFGRVLAFGSGSTMPQGASLAWIGMAISIALGLQVISATLIGAILPLVAARIKLDPAVVASPALTTIVDITGLLLFFGTAKLLLGV
ncbi:MAG: magnesium transporter [Planctomycetota bacterium]|jgi:magnesium transporter|nr:magnesium transporter [Planctomycetota bacterium]